MYCFLNARKTEAAESQKNSRETPASENNGTYFVPRRKVDAAATTTVHGGQKSLMDSYRCYSI